MAGFEQQVKQRARVLTDFWKRGFLKRGVKVVGNSCKKGWLRVKQMRK